MLGCAQLRISIKRLQDWIRYVGHKDLASVERSTGREFGRLVETSVHDVALRSVKSQVIRSGVRSWAEMELLSCMS